MSLHTITNVSTSVRFAGRQILHPGEARTFEVEELLPNDLAEIDLGYFTAVPPIPEDIFQQENMKVKVSTNDTTSGFLLEKITADAPITLTEVNNGADEDLKVGITLGTSAASAAAGNDARFPTTAQKEGLAGTSGAPSDTNRYITDQDARIPTTGENDALVGTDGAPSGVNPYVTDSDPRLVAGTPTIEVEEGGVPVPGPFDTLNFTGDGVSVTDAGGGQANIDVIHSISVSEEGIPVTGGPFEVINFVGAMVTATDGGSASATITVTPPTQTIDVSDEGTPVGGGTYTELNFVGAGVTTTDGGGGVATVTIPGAGGGGLTFVQQASPSSILPSSFPVPAVITEVNTTPVAHDLDTGGALGGDAGLVKMAMLQVSVNVTTAAATDEITLVVQKTGSSNTFAALFHKSPAVGAFSYVFQLMIAASVTDEFDAYFTTGSGTPSASASFTMPYYFK